MSIQTAGLRGEHKVSSSAIYQPDTRWCCANGEGEDIGLFVC